MPGPKPPRCGSRSRPSATIKSRPFSCPALQGSAAMHHVLDWSVALLAMWPVGDREPAPSATLKGHKHTITCLAFSREGNLLASGSKDGTAILWDVATK